MSQPHSWINEFFVEKGHLFGLVLRELRERGVEEARLIAEMLRAHGVPQGSRILELGCGIGRVAVPLAREGYRVTCLDISPSYIREAVEYARELGVAEGFEAVVGDAWSLDELVHGGYNAVLLVWTTLLGYRGTPESDVELLSKARSVTRPGGKLLILRQANRDLLVARQAMCGEGPYCKDDEGEVVVVENPKFDPVTSILDNTWTFYKRRGMDLVFLGRLSFTLKIYTVTEIIEIAEKAGWRLEALYGSLRMEPFIAGKSGVNAVFTNHSGV